MRRAPRLLTITLLTFVAAVGGALRAPAAQQAVTVQLGSGVVLTLRRSSI